MALHSQLYLHLLAIPFRVYNILRKIVLSQQPAFNIILLSSLPEALHAERVQLVTQVRTIIASNKNGNTQKSAFRITLNRNEYSVRLLLLLNLKLAFQQEESNIWTEEWRMVYLLKSK